MFKSASDFVSELVRLEKEMDDLESFVGLNDPANYDENGEYRGPTGWMLEELLNVQQRYDDLFNSPWICEAYNEKLLSVSQKVYSQELAKRPGSGYNADDPIMNLVNWIKAERDATGKEASGMFKRVKYTMPNGTVVNISGKSEQERAQQFIELAGMIVPKAETKEPAPLVNEVAEKWFDTWKEATIAEKGREVADIKNKHTSVFHHIIPTLGTIPLDKLNEDDLQGFLNKFEKKSTANKQWDVLRQILNKPLNRKYVDPDVLEWFNDKKHGPKCSKAKAEQCGYSEKDILAIDEAIPSLKTPRERVFISCALYAGLRKSEILALRFEDIDFEAGIINITKAVTFAGHDHNAATIKDTKNGDTRQVPLADKLRQRILELPHREGYLIRFAENVKARAGKDEPITQSSCSRLWKSIRKQIPVLTTGLKNSEQYNGIHQLRHAFASMLMNKGIDVETVAKIMGHRDVSVTLNVYATALESGIRKAKNVMDSMFQRAA